MNISVSIENVCEEFFLIFSDLIIPSEPEHPPAAGRAPALTSHNISDLTRASAAGKLGSNISSREYFYSTAFLKC